MNNKFENVDDYDLMVVKTRREKSKDSNGLETTIILHENNLKLTKRNWGFKADKQIKEISKEIDDKTKQEFQDFLEKNKMFRNYKKSIISRKKHSHTTYQIDLSIKKNSKKFMISTETNDSDTNNKYYKNSELFFTMLKIEINNELSSEEKVLNKNLQKIFMDKKSNSKKFSFSSFFRKRK